jgi:putative transposase
MAHVMNALPKSAPPATRAALVEIRDPDGREHAQKALERFRRDYPKWPKAVQKVTKDAEELLAFFDFPAEHWAHLKTTNPIESTFATIGPRTNVTKGPGSRAAGLAVAFKLIESAHHRW